MIEQKGHKNSMYYYRKAHRHGEVFAANRIGRCYLYGYGADVDYKKAFRYFAEGHSNGDYDATVNFGLCFEKGYGTKHSTDIAYEFYCDAVMAGNRAGVCELARMICEGKVSDVDKYDAFTILRSAYWRCLIDGNDPELNKLKRLIPHESYESQAMLSDPSIYLRLCTSTLLSRHFKANRYFIDNIVKAFDFYEVSIGPVVDTTHFLETAALKLTYLESSDLERLKGRGV